MTGEEVVARARSATRQGAHYGLGSGGFKAEWPTPWDPTDPAKRCDCSGFTDWSLGVAREVTPDHPLYGVFPDIWLGTNQIYADAISDSPGAFFSIPWESVAVGDLIVYKRQDKEHHGHIGIVSHISTNGPTAVIHCSLGNANSLGDAIAETSVLPFWRERKAVVARCSLVHPDAPPVA